MGKRQDAVRASWLNSIGDLAEASKEMQRLANERASYYAGAASNQLLRFSSMRTLEVLRNIAFAALVAGCSPLIHGQVPASSSPPLAEAKAEDETPPIRYQPGIKPPTVIYETRPDYTQEARNKKFSGNVQVYLWVETDGTPSHVQVKRPVGMGLDEKAVECIRKYRFKPAKLDGKPVKFELYIDVAFNPRFANP